METATSIFYGLAFMGLLFGGMVGLSIIVVWGIDSWHRRVGAKLRSENEKLHEENARYLDAFDKIRGDGEYKPMRCPYCMDVIKKAKGE